MTVKEWKSRRAQYKRTIRKCKKQIKFYTSFLHRTSATREEMLRKEIEECRKVIAIYESKLQKLDEYRLYILACAKGRVPAEYLGL